jgi:hypothetical protein
VLHGLSLDATVQKWTRDPDHMARPCSIGERQSRSGEGVLN